MMVNTLPSVSVAEHLALILAGVQALPPESVEVQHSLGRILAADVAAGVDVPGFDNSAMDGYAVRRADLEAASPEHPVTLTVIADLPAGSAATPEVLTGTAARIMTGAPVPAGADAIVPIEYTDEGTALVRVEQFPASAAHIRRRGTDVTAGAPVLTGGTRLSARHVAAAAAVGCRELSVLRRPRVAVISTGSELVEAGGTLAHGQIHDSNSHLLAASVIEAGGEALRIGAVPDDEDELRRVLEEVAEGADAIVLSGGVSVGAYDVVKAVLEPLGSMRFQPVRMQPGKPQGFGHWVDGTPIFALPGNPVSAFISFEVFVRPALRSMQGLPELHRPIVTAAAGSGWRSHTGRAQYMPVVVQREGEASALPVVAPATAGGSGSDLVASLAVAQGIAIVGETVDEVRAGDEVQFIRIDGDTQGAS